MMVAMQQDQEARAHTASRIRDLVVEGQEAVGGNQMEIWLYIRPMVRQDIALMDYLTEVGGLNVIHNVFHAQRSVVAHGSLLRPVVAPAAPPPVDTEAPTDTEAPSEPSRRPTGISRGAIISATQSMTGNRDWQRWDSWRLSSGMSLADAKMDNLEKDIESRVASLRGHNINAKFLEIVRSRLTDKEQRVAEVWTESELDTAMRQAEIVADETLKFFGKLGPRALS